MFKNILKIFIQGILSVLLISVMALGLYTLVTESYKLGVDAESMKTRVQTIAILDLTAENDKLNSTIITLNGNNATLRILVQTQQEEIDNLKSTVTNLNSSLTTLKNDKDAVDEVVENLESDIAYLNSYISQLEEELNELKGKVTVIYLPETFSGVTGVKSLKLTEDLLLISGSSSSVKTGIYTYSLSTQSFELVVEDVNLTNLFSLSDNLVLVENSGLNVVIYNHITKQFNIVPTADNTSAFKYLHHSTNYGVILLTSDNRLYEYDYINNVLTKTSIVQNFGLFIAEYGTKVCISSNSSTSASTFVYDLEEKTVTTIKVGLFYKYNLSKTQFLASSTNGGMYLFDVTTGEITQLSTVGKQFSDFHKFNGNIYCTSTGYIHYLNLTTMTVTDLELSIVTITAGYSKANFVEFSNGLLYSNSTVSTSYQGLYYMPYDLSSVQTLISSGYGYTYIPHNNGLIVTCNYNNSGITYIDETTLEVTQLYAKGCDYTIYYDLGNNVLFSSKSSSSSYIVMLNKETNEVKELIYGYAVDLIYENDDYYVFIHFSGIFRISKTDNTFESLFSANGFYLYDTLDNGNYLFKVNQSAFAGMTFMLDITDCTFKAYSYELAE